MEVIQTGIKDLILLQPKVFKDPRGYFFESYNREKFQALGMDIEFTQDNQSLSSKGILRGLHFQKPPHAQGKLVRVIKGAVLDVAVDIRKDSPTYGQHFLAELTESNFTMMYVPVGFAHGFLTLSDDTIFSYKCTDTYHPESEGGLPWNDTDLNIQWGIDDPIMSEKDKIFKPFKDFVSPF
jgi:dTDP-4-dehydrorhamnose 3,5-epimerase